MRGRDLASAAAGCAALGVAVFAIGGALRWAQAGFAIFVAFALIPIVTSRRSFGRPAPLLVLLGSAALLTAVQLIPLPTALLDVVQPTGHGLRRDGADLLGTSPWPSVSLDVPATLQALAFFIALLGLAVVALRTATAERGRYYMLAAVAACCGLAAVIVGIHEILGARDLYGIYELKNVNPHLIGPLLNLNHLGGLMAVGTIVSMSLAAYRRYATWLRVLWLVNAAACASAAVATVSRGATLALVAGSLVAGATLVAQRLAATDAPRRRRTQFLTTSLPIGIVAICAVLVVVFSNAGHVMSQLSETSLDELGDSRSKFAAWTSSIALVKEAPVLGVGRGAFETSFTRVHPGSGQATFSHVENEYLQTVLDWGLVGGAIILVIAAWVASRALRRWRDGALAAGALGGLAAVTIHSTVDFGLELLGLAAPVTVLLASLTYVPLRDQSSTRAKTASRALRIAHAVALLACAALLLSSLTTTTDEDHDQLRATPTGAAIQAAGERHPLDYYVFAIAAERADRANDPAAIRLLNHAMTLHPTHPGLHRTAARMLVRRGYLAQAAIEYGVALRVSSKARAVLTEIAERLPVEHAIAAIPADYRDPQGAVRVFEELRRNELTIAFLRRLVQRADSRSKACDLLFAPAIRGDEEAGALAMAHCIDPPPDYSTRLSLARTFERKGEHARVEQLVHDVESWHAPMADKRAAWLMLCDALALARRWDEAKSCLRRLDILPEGRGEDRAVLERRLQEVEQARRAAAEVAPSGPVNP